MPPKPSRKRWPWSKSTQTTASASSPQSVHAGSSKLLVAAIDFGTTFSGWAFLFGHQFTTNPTQVFAKNWNNGTNISPKTPTTILIKPDGRTIEAFGYEAEDRYAELASANKHQKYYYFRRFKMMLFDKLLTREILLDDEEGKQLPALTIFSLSIKYLKDNLLEECRQQIVGDDITNADVDWVITVPAIWNEAAKQFMREAAVKAGIPNNKLQIALEPEAASLFCKHMAVEKKTSAAGITMDSFSPGSKYIVLDAGGGTVDITVHEVLPDGGLKELHKASGGAWGGTKVDENFNQFLIKIFGAPIMKKFKKENMDDYLDFFRIFELKKREVVADREKSIQFRLPASLVELFKDETDEDLKETVQKISYGNNVTLKPGNKLQVDDPVMKSFFNGVIGSIVEHLETIFKEKVVRDAKFILLVGGFSESQMFKKTLEAKFRAMHVVAAPEASLVVLKGAAIFGHCNDIIQQRVARYSYGFNATDTFEEGLHPEGTAVMFDGDKHCEDVFFKLVEIGETLSFNERREWEDTVIPFTDTTTTVELPVYSSTNKDPVCVTDDGCTHIGTLEIEVTKKPVAWKDREFRIIGIFGQTEIRMEVLEISTGKLTTATFDALWH